MLLDTEVILYILDKLLDVNNELSSIIEEVEDAHVPTITNALDKIESIVDVISDSIEF